MRFWLLLVCAWTAVQVLPAAADPWRRHPAVQGQPDRPDRGQFRQRDNGRPERMEREERPRRLSEEERRGLHRDLDKARREIYRPQRER